MVKFFKIDQVSEILQVSRSKCYELVSSGELVSHRIAGSIRISETDLETYLESCREKPEDKSRRISPPRLKHVKLS